MRLKQGQAFIIELIQKFASILFLFLAAKKISVVDFGEYGYYANLVFFSTILSTQGLDVLSNRFLPYYSADIVLKRFTKLKNINATFFALVIILITVIQGYSFIIAALIITNLLINVNLNLWNLYYHKEYLIISLFKIINVLIPIIYICFIEKTNAISLFLVVVFSLLFSALLFILRRSRTRGKGNFRYTNMRIRKLSFQIFVLLILSQILFRFDPFIVKIYLDPVEFGKYEFHSRLVFLLVMVLTALMDIFKNDFIHINESKLYYYKVILISLSAIALVSIPTFGGIAVKYLFAEYYIDIPLWYTLFGILVSLVILSFQITFPSQLNGRIKTFRKSLIFGVAVSLTINLLGYFFSSVFIPVIAMILGLLTLNLTYLRWKI